MSNSQEENLVKNITNTHMLLWNAVHLLVAPNEVWNKLKNEETITFDAGGHLHLTNKGQSMMDELFRFWFLQN